MVIVEGVRGVLRSDFTKNQDIIKIRPTDPLQNLLCNPKHIYIFLALFPKGVNTMRGAVIVC